MAFGHKARQSLRAKVVHNPFLGALQKCVRLPAPGLLIAMHTVCQVPQLSDGFGIRDGPFGLFQGAPASGAAPMGSLAVLSRTPAGQAHTLRE